MDHEAGRTTKGRARTPRGRPSQSQSRPYRSLAAGRTATDVRAAVPKAFEKHAFLTHETGVGHPAGVTFLDGPKPMAVTEAGASSLAVLSPAKGLLGRMTLPHLADATAIGDDGSWQHVTMTYTPASPGSSTLDLTVRTSTPARALCYLIDDGSIVTS